ncbi:MAG: hypothetical protein APF78_12545 [Sphingomonadales bacterium BRH_c3]|nr:MAG: hypothetical protein APF78_12545 [Sphingomonadales bacterium BRH_c3]
MTIRARLNRFLRDARGSTIIEFALLAPVLIVATIGVFHVAIYMQNYNSLRSIASDTARRVMIEYQKENQVSPIEIEAIARSIAVGAPYLLETDQLQVTVTQAGTSRVQDATEMDIAIAYLGEDFLPLVNIDALNMTYSRPIFVFEE